MKKKMNTNVNSDVSTIDAALAHVNQTGGETKGGSNILAKNDPKTHKGYAPLETVPIRQKSKNERGDGY